MTGVSASASVPGPAPDHDVIVIGGGVNGTGVARDCALRGLSVALFEKHDLAFGASGNSSGMVHGGARYLTTQPGVTRLSCLDSGIIQRIAPHLLFRIPFLYPVRRRGIGSRVFLAGVDAFFAFYDRYQPLKRGRAHTLLDADELGQLLPGLRGRYQGAVSFDEWGIDGTRLCVLNALDAREHGAAIHVHHEVTRILQDDDGHVQGVEVVDRLTGARREVTARVVVNASGAWGPLTAGLARGAQVRLRPGKGIHVVLDRRLCNYAVGLKAVDGRTVFYMPWQNLSFIGTTDDDYYGDLDDVRATTDEVRYLLTAAARILPSVNEARVIGTTAGVRPTLPAWGRYEDDLSREHEILDHGARDGVPGLFSMVGGKLASYRLFAEQMSDRIAEELGSDRPCVTHERPLPGGEDMVHTAELAESFGVPEPAVRRLAYRHGRRAEHVLARLAERPHERGVVCACEPVLECEVRHACRAEGARTLADVSRRTRLGLGACGAMRCAHRGAQVVADELGRPPEQVHVMAAELLAERFRSRAPALDVSRLRQEEMLRGRFAAAGLGALT